MKKLIIGKILRPKGLKGEMKVQPITSDISQFLSLKNVIINYQTYVVISAKINQGFVYMTLQEIDSVEKAETFRDKFIEKERTSSKGKNDEFYIVDMLNSTVVDENGVEYGEITSIDSYGAADVLTIVGRKGEFTLPYVEGLVTNFDIEKKIITIDSKRYEEVVVI